MLNRFSCPLTNVPVVAAAVCAIPACAARARRRLRTGSGAQVWCHGFSSASPDQTAASCGRSPMRRS
jgi:hypothetical protein